ncbi:MAG: DUF433 domain-containing protein [Nitrospinota bacterium]
MQLISRKQKGHKFFRAQDLRTIPTYKISEAAHYLSMPESTLRSWALGQTYRTRAGRRLFRPILSVPDPSLRLLSFLNLVEAHILNAIRRKHKVPPQKVRKAIFFLKDRLGSQSPLIESQFETNGLDLFVDHYGKLINASQDGQLAMREVLILHLQRIERDRKGVPIKLFPFTFAGKDIPPEPKAVVIDPLVSFGRPVLAGTGIPTVVIAERWKAGEAIESLMRDFGRSREEILEAIRCEFHIRAA